MTSLDKSLTNTLSKADAEEELTSFLANMKGSLEYPDPGGAKKKVPISNERIRKGNQLLEIYEVVSDPIEGGMGSVWKVHHRDWDTDLAMKRPQPHLFAEAGEGRKKLFVEECENWIRLGPHPQIVNCYYVREIGGVPTVFSEWMDGGSLKDRIRDESLYQGSVREVQRRIMNIAIHAAMGLEYSNDQNLVHQDMKPGNLLLTKDWAAKVADFGLARARGRLHEAEQDRNRQDGNGQAGNNLLSVGYTLQYCPQEQVDGERPREWMDIFSWALTVLEMYAGKRLWETGADAKEHCREYFQKCRVPVHPEVQRILLRCILGREDKFRIVSENFQEAYAEVLGKSYLERAYRSMMDTVGNINNYALSYLDIGRPDLAENSWKRALRASPDDKEVNYNRALYRLRSGQIDESGFLSELTQFATKTGQKMEDYIRDYQDGKRHYIIHRPNTMDEVLDLNSQFTHYLRRANWSLTSSDAASAIAYLEKARQIKGLENDTRLLDSNERIGELAKRVGIRRLYSRVKWRLSKIIPETLCCDRYMRVFFFSVFSGFGEFGRSTMVRANLRDAKIWKKTETAVRIERFATENNVLAAAHGGNVLILDKHMLTLKCQFSEFDQKICPQNEGNEVTALRINREEQILAVCRRNGMISVFDLNKVAFLRNIPSRAGEHPVFDLTPDGKMLLTAGSEDPRELCVWDVFTGELIDRHTWSFEITDAYFTEDPKQLIASNEAKSNEANNTLYLLDRKSALEQPLPVGTGLTRLTPVTDGKWFSATDSSLKKLLLFPVKEPEKSLIRISLPPSFFEDEKSRFLFSPSGNFLMTYAENVVRTIEIDWIYEAPAGPSEGQSSDSERENNL